MRDKHSSSYAVNSEVLSSHEFDLDRVPLNVIFDSLDAEAVRRAAGATNGAWSPPGIDAYVWRRLCTSFGKEYDNKANALQNALALLTRSLCSRFCDPSVLVPLLACRLIAIDKNLGVRPIGIGEVVCCIVAKAAISVVKSDLLDSIGCKQLCVREVGGVEAVFTLFLNCLIVRRKLSFLLMLLMLLML